MGDGSGEQGAKSSFAPAMLGMYRDGWFPMYSEEKDEVEWLQPQERAVFDLRLGGSPLRMTRSWEQRIRSRKFVLTTDRAFERVIRECAAPRLDPDGEPAGQWIDRSIVVAYCGLHAEGVAHSVEAWLPRDSGSVESGGDPLAFATKEPEGAVLVGGLYGVCVGGVFCGESMFSRPERGGRDASKVCLGALVRHLQRRGFWLLDSQILNPHVESLGAVEWPREQYLDVLAQVGETDLGW